MLNVVLLAGHGRRFAEAGYSQSKPLLPVEGRPMVLRAIETMPRADRWVFVVRKEHLGEPELIDALKSVHTDVKIVVDPDPVGQLDSCLIARDELQTDEQVFVGACDVGIVCDADAYERIMVASERPDLLVFSFSEQPTLRETPHSYGWLVKNGDRVEGVSVKIPVSDDPFLDEAIVGAFTFCSGRYLLRVADELVKQGTKVKGEFYIDSLVGLAADRGDVVRSFVVDQFISWGVPADYEKYRHWSEVFGGTITDEVRRDPEFSFWEAYFRG